MASRRFRVLSLDGGGVRGLSALYVLRRLLCLVNEELHGLPAHPIEPQKVFDIVVGTSTGGLIALMIVKLGMGVDECIEQYKNLSREIFGRPHLLGKFIGGFGPTKYSSKRMQKLLVDLVTSMGRPADHTMEDVDQHQDLECSVICRELENNHTKQRRRHAVFLCSHHCRPNQSRSDGYEECKVADAARATTAAPTYFDPVWIANRILVDGGYGQTNNPSREAWRHYSTFWDISKADWVQWVNIGTGTLAEDAPLPRRQWKDFLPTCVQNFMHAVRDLQRIASDTEDITDSMRELSEGEEFGLEFHRLSATHGVHAISLDDYRAIDTQKLERLTKQYLSEPQVDDRLRILARSLVADHVDKTNSDRTNTETPTTLAFVESHRATETSSVIHRPGPRPRPQAHSWNRLSAESRVPSMATSSILTADEILSSNPTPRSKSNDRHNLVSTVLSSSSSAASCSLPLGESHSVMEQIKMPDSPDLRFSTPTRTASI